LTLVFTPAMLVLPEFVRARVMPRLSGVPTQQSD
jgi:hypothetical protein